MGFKRMKLRRFVHPPWSQHRTKLLRHSSISIGFQFALASLSPIDQVICINLQQFCLCCLALPTSTNHIIQPRFNAPRIFKFELETSSTRSHNNT